MNEELLKRALYQSELSWPVIGFILGIAFILGAIHALGPGHGKSLMAAYLVGSAGRVSDAVTLALTLTISHVLSVVVLAFLAFWITDFFMPELATRWLALFSGVSILVIGGWLLITRWHRLKKSLASTPENLAPSHNHPGPEHASVFHAHEGHVAHPHGHFSVWHNLSLGISAGIVPCPKALVILLLAISLQKISLGILIIVFFSLGLAVVLVTLGIIMLKAADLLKGRLETRRWQFLPVLGAGLIILLGIFWIIRAGQFF
ncbi:sulfite exporter TauE/SafE family protein [candidate division KSB1 bacterium]|nr:sulfite exporter TauE/SafE family protein [candidate division KSB1 bacterium]